MDDVIVDAERKQVSRASLIPESATTDAGRTEKKMIEDAAEPKLPRKRVMCPRCARPSPSACICAALPGQKIQLRRSQCLILQHPHETKLKNRSLPLVELCVDPRNITVTIGRRFGLDSAVMKQMERRTNQPVWLLSPEEGAIPLTQAIEERENKERDVLVIVLDATWKVR